MNRGITVAPAAGSGAEAIHPLPFLDVLRIGSIGLRSRRLRALLSALGIAIGIAAIVGVVGISATSKAALLARLDEMSNLLTVQPGQTIIGQTQPLPPTAAAQARYLGAAVREVSATADLTTATIRRTPVVPVEETGGITVTATDPRLPDVTGTVLLHGVFLNDATSQYPCVVLGHAAAQVLGVRDVAGQHQVWIHQQWFRVVGILAASSTVPGVDQRVFIGFTAAEKLTGFDGHPTQLYVRTDPGQVDTVRQQLARTLVPQHPEAVQVSRPSDALAARLATSNALTGLLVALGSVAILVGGVGVGNVMVITVLERRQEIGLRRALGATRGQIAVQFLTESLFLALLGGTGGVVLGTAVTVGYAAATQQPATLSAATAGLSLLASLAVGGLAGLYPAVRASRLTPTDALRAA